MLTPSGFVAMDGEQAEGGKHSVDRLCPEEVLDEELGGLIRSEKTVKTGEDIEGRPAVVCLLQAAGHCEGEVHWPSSSQR